MRSNVSDTRKRLPCLFLRTFNFRSSLSAIGMWSRYSMSPAESCLRRGSSRIVAIFQVVPLISSAIQ